MEHRFSAQDWAKLSNPDRVRCCRTMANEALKIALSAPSPMKESYLSLAKEWEKVASELQQNSN